MIGSVERVVEALNEGLVVAVPTDTVYGLVCRDLEGLYRVKPRDKPCTVLCAGLDQLDLELSVSERTLAESVWPGAVTIVFECGIGVRVPKYETLLEVLKRVGPVYSTSCNLSGKGVCQSVEEIESVFGDLLIMEGDVGSGVPSRVMRSNGKVLRD